MAQFYKELKELRETRKISLEEISERTKINIQYLISIESGELNDIEVPYLRLFLRAYAEEIGGDSQRALEQLDSFMGTNKPAIVTTTINDENIDEDDKQFETSEIERKQNFFFINKKLRQDYLVGIVFSFILIFSIIIFQKIFNEESKAIVTNEGPILKQKIEPLTNLDLLKDFILDQSSIESLSIPAPYFIKIKSTQQTAYTFLNDSIGTVSEIINANQEKDLNPFIEKSELIFSSTKGLTLFINSKQINQISEYLHPLKIIVKPKPPSMSIQRYKPLQ